MNYPEKLKKGDTIGICAPSAGVAKPEKIIRLEPAIKQLKDLGYKVIETDSVRKDERGRSASAEIRAKEFMELMENDDVKLIIFASGGDFLCEMIDYLDFDKLKKIQPKWLQGYSDITGISFLFNTILDVPTMYCQTVKDYAMKPLHKSLTDALKIESGEEIIQKSFELFEKPFYSDNTTIENIDPCAPYNLTEKVEWKNICGGNVIKIKGRSIGGCLDCIQNFIGTKYDNVKNYIEKHKKDGIVWFLEAFEMSTPSLFRLLWQMKNADYFKNCNGIIFGRPLFIRNDYDISFNETVKDALGDLNIPIICDADIGHVSPQLAIVNGAILEIISENGKGLVKTYLK